MNTIIKDTIQEGHNKFFVTKASWLVMVCVLLGVVFVTILLFFL